MPTPASTKYEIIKTPYGKYVWWPSLQLVDFVPIGKHKGQQIASLPEHKNTQLYACIEATKHMRVFYTEMRADQRLKEETLGITDKWQD